MKKYISILICILFLFPLISSFGTLIDTDSFLTESQVETYINNSNFNFGNYNLTMGGGFFEGTLIPLTTLTWDIGSGANRWRTLYIQNISADEIDVAGNVTASGYLLGDGSFLTGVSGIFNSTAWNRSGTNVFLNHIGDDVGIGTKSPYSGLHYQGDIFYLTPNAGADSNDNITIKNYATSNGAPNIILKTADISGAYGISVGMLSLIGGSKTTHYGGIDGGGGKISLQGGQGRNAANNPSGYAPVLLQSKGGSVGIGTDSPGRIFEIFGSASIFRFRDSGPTNSSTTAYIEFGGTDAAAWNRTGYIGDGSSGNKAIYLRAEASDLYLGDSTSDSVLTLSGGDATFSGIVYGSNLFIPQYLYAHTNATIPILGASEWTNITFAQEDTDVKFGISHIYNDNTNHTFTIMQDGVYEIDFDIDVEDTSAGASDVDIAGRVIYVNGTEIIGSEFETDITKQGVETELSHDFLAIFKAGDEIVVQFVATDEDVQISTHATFGDYPESASVVINKVANL